MGTLIYALNKKFNVKRFIAFSFFIYPLGITISILPTVFPDLTRLKLLLYIFAYLLFATSNWIWSQKKFRFTLLLLSLILGTVWLSFTFNGFDVQKKLDFFPAIALLPVMFPVFLLSQFSAWTPTIIYYLIKTHNNSPQVVLAIIYLVIFAIIGYIGAHTIIQTVVSSPGF